MDKSRKLVFFGNERLATGVSTTAPVLRGLTDAGYDIVAVVSSPAESQGRRRRGLEIADVAAKHEIPLLPDKLSDIKNQLSDFQAAAEFW